MDERRDPLLLGKAVQRLAAIGGQRRLGIRGQAHAGPQQGARLVAMQALEHCDYDGTLGKLSDEQLSRMRAANRELQLLELFLLAGRLSLTMLPRYLKAMDVHVNLTERLQLEGGAELKAAGDAFRSQLKVWQTVQADARDMAHKLDSWQG